MSFATLDQDGRLSQAFHSLFLQETSQRDVLMPSLMVSYSHTDQDIDLTVAEIDGALDVYRQALETGVERYKVGRPSQVFYRRYNRPEPGPARHDQFAGDGTAEVTPDVRRPISV